MPNRKSRWEAPVAYIPYHPLLHLLSDTAALFVAWHLTRDIRFLLNPYLPLTLSRAGVEAAAPPLTVLLLLWLLTATGRKTYHRKAGESLIAGLLRVTESATLVNSIAVILIFSSRQLGASLSRSFVLIFVPVSLLCLTLSFLVTIAIAAFVERRWPWQKRVAVLGFGKMAQDVVHAIHISPERGVSLRGLIVPELALAAAGGGGAAPPLPVLGTTRDLAEVINRESLDRIIVACDVLTEPQMDQWGEVIRRMGVTVSRPIPTRLPDVLVSYQNQYGLHLVDLEAKPFTRWQEVLKRGTDIILSFTLITLLLPLLAIVACLIRLTSRGPVLYRSLRVGKGGRYFLFWKFRSMYWRSAGHRELAECNEQTGHVFKMRRDPRITPVGRILRRFSLDELPQLFNVLAGHMSIVGPRPLPVEDLDPDGMSGNFREWAEHRARVRPGITGLWQVRGRSEVPFDQMVELDIDYIRNWSLSLDIAILLATPGAVISGRGAY